LRNYFAWTGDKELITELFPDVIKGIKWLLNNDIDGNGYPNGISLAISQKSDHIEYSGRQTLADWTIIVDVKNSKKVMVNYKEMNPENITGNKIMLNGQEITVLIYQ